MLANVAGSGLELLRGDQEAPAADRLRHRRHIGTDHRGNLYYADIGIVISADGVGPGERTGTVRRIRFVDGEPKAPQTMDRRLAFPDRIGVLAVR